MSNDLGSDQVPIMKEVSLGEFQTTSLDQMEDKGHGLVGFLKEVKDASSNADFSGRLVNPIYTFTNNVLAVRQYPGKRDPEND